MAEDIITISGDMNGTSDVDILTGPAAGRSEVYELDIYNGDDITHTLTLMTYISSAQRIFRKITLPPSASYIWEGKIALHNGEKIQGKLAADSPHVTWHTTYRTGI